MGLTFVLYGELITWAMNRKNDLLEEYYILMLNKNEEDLDKASKAKIVAENEAIKHELRANKLEKILDDAAKQEPVVILNVKKTYFDYEKRLPVDWPAGKLKLYAMPPIIQATKEQIIDDSIKLNVGGTVAIEQNSAEVKPQLAFSDEELASITWEH